MEKDIFLPPYGLKIAVGDIILIIELICKSIYLIHFLLCIYFAKLKSTCYCTMDEKTKFKKGVLNKKDPFLCTVHS